MFKIRNRGVNPPSTKRRTFYALYKHDEFKDVITLLNGLEYNFIIVHVDREFILTKFNATKDFLKVIEIAGDFCSGGLLNRIKYSNMLYPTSIEDEDYILYEDNFSIVKGAIKTNADIDFTKEIVEHTIKVMAKSIFSKRINKEINVSKSYLNALTSYITYKTKYNEYI